MNQQRPPPAGQPTNQPLRQSQQILVPPATQYVIRQAPMTYENYAEKQSLALGSIQICCGFLCIICNIVIFAIAYEHTPAHGGTGIWTGCFFILSGFFGVNASKEKTKCTIVTFMALSIFSAILAFILLIVAAISWSQATEYNCMDNCHAKRGLAAMNGITVCASVVQIFVGIWSSGICCGVICCYVAPDYQQQNRVIPVDLLSSSCLQQQVIYMHPGSPGVVMYNPQVAHPQPGMSQGMNVTQLAPQYGGQCAMPLKPPPYEPPYPSNPNGPGNGNAESRPSNP